MLFFSNPIYPLFLKQMQGGGERADRGGKYSNKTNKTCRRAEKTVVGRHKFPAVQSFDRGRDGRRQKEDLYNERSIRASHHVLIYSNADQAFRKRNKLAAYKRTNGIVHAIAASDEDKSTGRTWPRSCAMTLCPKLPKCGGNRLSSL